MNADKDLGVVAIHDGMKEEGGNL